MGGFQMFGDTQELAESKLILLYIFNKINRPISNIRITEIVLENSLLNYFHLQQYLGELVSSNFLLLSREDKKQIYSISLKGKSVLEYFENRISENKIHMIDKYLEERGQAEKEDVKFSAEYFASVDTGYEVVCRMSQKSATLIELKLIASSSEQADHICSSWKSKGRAVYRYITETLNE
jgi:predicted transcriptional regulator